ncbi:MAG: LPXTG cell wall anchor domain-containing protein [Lachnospiraceae bacterium]|nr:LPXTG cell wall anchor domain-containing protein [Lachnospiraceae bacterium]
MKGIRKWLLAAALAVAMAASTPQTVSYAAESRANAVSYQTCDADGKNWTTQSCSDYTEVASDTTTWSDGGWYVVNGEITVDSRITASGTVHLILADGCELKAAGGIQVDGSLTVYAQSQDDSAGKLTAVNTKADYYAGIGVSQGKTLTINGGVVTATGKSGAGIGGSNKSGITNIQHGGTVIINGGMVTAQGDNTTAGIGGANSGNNGTVIINGGTVTATGGNYGAGIGGGHCGRDTGQGGTIRINGGKVTARGGTSSAGIGGGAKGSGGNITISGGEVEAYGSTYGPGIGGGGDDNWSAGGSGGSITISGGKVTASGGEKGVAIGGGGSLRYSGGASGNITISNVEVQTNGIIGAGIGKDGETGSTGTINVDNATINGETCYTVTFDANGQSEVKVPAQIVASGGKAEEPFQDIEGKAMRWYTEAACSNLFDFNTQISQSTTLYVKLEESTDYVAKVVCDGSTVNYTTFKAAWASLSGKTSTITLLKDVTTTAALTISSGTDVTVEMEEGVTLTNNVNDCFSIDGGALTLASGSVVEGGEGKSLVYAASGTLHITGGSYQSVGNGLWIDSGVDVGLSGGTITATGTVLRYDQHGIGDMLDTEQEGKCFAFYDSNSQLITEGLTKDKLGAGTYRVGECTHNYQYTHIESTTTHDAVCPACKNELKGEKCHYEWEEGQTVGNCVCKSTLTVSMDDASLIYNGSAQTPVIIIGGGMNGENKLTEGTDYEITGSDNINAGTNASVTVSGKTYEGTFTSKFTIKRATPDIGAVTAEEMENTFQVSEVVLKRGDQSLAGTLTLTPAEDFALNYGQNTCAWKFTPDDRTNYEDITGEVEITVKDTIHPTASYQIGENSWKKFANTISFGLFCKEYVNVTIEYSDDVVSEDGNTITGSGIAEQLYYISDRELTETEAASKDIQWEAYTDTVHLEADGVYFIYVKVTDKEGNTAIYNSEGIVIYADSVWNTGAIEYTYKQNQDCTVRLTMNGNTFRELADKDGNVIAAENYEAVTAEDSCEITLKASYLDTLNKGEYTYKAIVNPQGINAEEVTLEGVEASEATLEYTFTVTVKAKELEVTGATATDRDYDESNEVEITEVTLSGVASGDDVTADWNGGKGTLDGTDAGKYTSVTLPEITLVGSDKDNYTLVQPEGAVPTDVTINRIDAEITLETAEYSKTFGDGVFTFAVTDTNKEADVQYEVTKGKDVVSVSEDGTVTILGVGSAEITVSLPESINYNAAADQTIIVNVTKRGGYVAEAINRSYIYTKENTDTSNLAVLLPKDCGTANYGTPSTSGAVVFQTVEVKDGTLSYTLGKGNAGDEGTITVVAETQNYEDILITVNVSLTDRMPVRLKEGTEVTLENNILTYGEALSKLKFNNAEFIADDGKAVEGTLAWKNGELIPEIGTVSAVWVFTPADQGTYASLEGMVAITVEKAVPIVKVSPSVAERLYNPSTALENSDLSGDSVVGVDGKALEGAWSWKSAKIVPTVGNDGYVAVFTPKEETKYETVEEIIPVNVTKATPYIAELPAASEITYGDILNASLLSGGTVQYGDGAGQAGNAADSEVTVEGVFAWKESSVKPAVADSNQTEYVVLFTPSDMVNYETVEGRVKLTVQKAEHAPNMPDSAMNVSNNCEKVSDVTLPEGWEWQEEDQDTALIAGTAVNAVAVYKGADQGNYEKETVMIAVTRAACDHVEGDILYTGAGEKAPTCTEDGLGHRECTKCNGVTKSGIVVPALGHDYKDEVTQEPTVDSEGIRTYTCTRCGDSYTEPIDKLEPDETPTPTENPDITPEPTGEPDVTSEPTEEPDVTSEPTEEPDVTSEPTDKPDVTSEPTEEPDITSEPTEEPDVTSEPTEEPDVTSEPTEEPDVTSEPTEEPDVTSEPTEEPDGIPAPGNPFIKGESGKKGWDAIRAEEEKAEERSIINVDMNGAAVVPGDIFDCVKGRDITITFDMGNNIIWNVNGKSIVSDRVGDIDFSVKVGTNSIPVDIIDSVSGEHYSILLSLAHDGEFGFTAILSTNLGKENTGRTASLYYYNRNTGELELLSSDKVAEDGKVSFVFTHASDYVIVIGDNQQTDGGNIEDEDRSDNGGTALKESPKTGQDQASTWPIAAGLVALAGIAIMALKAWGRKSGWKMK